MKNIFQKLIALALFTALFQVSVQADPVHIVAHRGFWKSEAARGAQNSKASFREAMNHNLWGSEFDVKLTKDLVPVVFHDREINGKSIAGSTYAELKNEVLPNGEKLPTLDEFLSSIPKDTFTRLVFELKAPIPFTTELADILIDKSVASLRKFGLLAPEKTLFIAGSAYICKQVAAKLPGFTVQSLAKDRTPEEVFADGVNGILYEMLYPAGMGMDADFVYAPGFTFTANSSNPDNARITAEGPGEGTLRMYRDSFGRNLYPYLAESFALAEFSRKTNYDPTDLPEGGALVIELVERNLRYLNVYAPVLPAPEGDGAQIRNAVPRGELAVSIRDGALSGSFGELKPDDTSPVYVSRGGRVYEAVPQPEGFTALLPEGANDFEVIFTSQGELVSLRGVME